MKTKPVLMVLLLGGAVGAGFFVIQPLLRVSPATSSAEPFHEVEAVPQVLLDKDIYRKEQECITPDQSEYSGTFRHLANGCEVTFEANIYLGPGRFTMKTDEATKFSVMWILGNGPRKSEFPSGRGAGLYQSTT